MKNKAFRLLVSFVFSLLLFCLLLSGAPRLIAGMPEQAAPEPLRVVQAYLCANSVDFTLIRHDASANRTLCVEKREASLSGRSGQHALPPVQLHADANGNILCASSLSYMRCVYQSFDLGDGFA